MIRFADPVPVLKELDTALQTRFEDTNRAIADGSNPHFKMLTGRTFRVLTPKQDEEESEPLRHLFPERHYVPLTEILATVQSSYRVRHGITASSPDTCERCVREDPSRRDHRPWMCDRISQDGANLHVAHGCRGTR